MRYASKSKAVVTIPLPSEKATIDWMESDKSVFIFHKKGRSAMVLPFYEYSEIIDFWDYGGLNISRCYSHTPRNSIAQFSPMLSARISR